jgi:hypothetical protein
MKDGIIKLSKFLRSNGFYEELEYLNKLVKVSQEVPSYAYFIPGFEEKHLNVDSNYSHFEGTSDELKDLILSNWNKAYPSPQKNGAMVIPLPPDKFKSGVVRLNEDSKLHGIYEPHMGHREHRKGLVAEMEEKPQADYARAISSEPDGFGSISIYTILAGVLDSKENPDKPFEEPMTPQTMMYNRYGYGNIDKSFHNSEEFDELLHKSFNYWKDKAFFKKKK